MSPQEITGRVKWYNPAKAYGFIARDDGQGDVFVHRSALDAVPAGTLREGDHVAFTVEMSPRGPRAENVRLIA
ncbi:MAG: cold-shock protein [Candidatus Latescibacterota bacterium]|nr:MAG: cold-shock protein [Candidatus Latescibacterota bacterium]